MISRSRIAEQLRGERGDWTTPAFQEELDRRIGALAREYKLGTDARARRRLLKHIEAGEPTDGRIRSGRRAKEYDPRLWAEVDEKYLHPNKFTAVDACDEQKRLAKVLGVEAIPDWKVKAHIRGLAYGVKVKTREGPRPFEMKCTPKAMIDYSNVPAGSWLCLDGRCADVQVRVPDGRGGWKATRPVVNGVMDLRSTLMRANVCATENSSGILAV